MWLNTSPLPTTLVTVVTLDHNGKMLVKYVGAYTMKAMRKSAWVSKVYASNLQETKYFWVPKPKA
jgi:hypothetical protein